MIGFLLNPLVLKALAGLIFVASVAGFVAYRDHNIRVKERAKWEVKVAECKTATDTAVKANLTLQASADKLVAQVTEQNAQIKRLGEVEATARKARDAALAALATRERVLREEVARLTVIASAPPVESTPAVCEDAASILRSYAGKP